MDLLLNIDVPDLAAAERFYVATFGLVPTRRLGEGEIREADWGRIVQLADPFGHGWCLLQFLGRGYDEIADPAPALPTASP